MEKWGLFYYAGYELTEHRIATQALHAACEPFMVKDITNFLSCANTHWNLFDTYLAKTYMGPGHVGILDQVQHKSNDDI